MKRLFTFAALLALPLAMTGCEAETPEKPATPAAPESGSETTSLNEATAAELASYEGPMTFKVPDMHCAIACSPKVEKTLAAMDGVSDIKTDVDARTVTFTATKDFDVEAAKKALADEDYPVENVMI